MATWLWSVINATELFTLGGRGGKGRGTILSSDSALTVSPRSPLWRLLCCISAMEPHCQWPTASGRTRQCLDPTAIEYCMDFPLRRGPGRPQGTTARGCPDTSPRKQSRTGALWSCPLSALGSQGNPRQKTQTLTSNSRAPCSKDASFPCPLCYYVLSFRSFFFGGGVPLIQLEVYVNSYLSKGKQLRGGGRKGDGYYHLIHHQFLLISHKHLCPTSAKEEKCKCPHSEHRDCPIWGACTWQGCRCPFSHLLPGSSNHPTTTPYNQSTSHSHCFVITSHERESSASPVPCPGLSETRSHWEFRPLPWTYGQFPHSEGGRSLRNPTIDLSLGHCPECIWCGLAMTTSNGVQVNGFLQTINHLRKCCPPKFISQ